MLKTILGLNPLRESDLSYAALWRLRVSAVIAISVMPIVTLLDKLSAFENFGASFKLVLTIGVIVSLIPLGFSRMNSLFTRSKKDLDEWELTARVEAESFTFRSIGLILVLMFLAFVVFTLNRDIADLNFAGEDMFYLLGNLVLLCVTLPVAFTAWRQKPLGLQ